MITLAPANPNIDTYDPFARGPVPWQIENVVDTRRLTAQLAAAAGENIGNPKTLRERAMELLHGALFRGRMIAQERLNAGDDGLSVARLLAEVQNQVVIALYDFTTTHAFAEQNLTSGEKLAVLAVGGYARNVLAPSSDIDLLFLRNYKQTPWAESVIEYMLYMLWDMGLKVGHAFRTVDECIRLAKEDLNTETALLDARFITGDEKIANELFNKYHNEMIKGKSARFIAAKLKERDDRHRKQGDNRYVVEPQVKEGKGGLRDLQTLYWLVRHTYGGVTLEDILAHEDIFTATEAETFRNAGKFLWAVRCYIHFLTGRPEDRLSFDLQPEIAKRMGYHDEGERLGVERFMKQYFLETKSVGALTRILCAKLEADQQKSIVNLLDILPIKIGQQIKEPGFKLEAGRLSIDDPALFFTQPVKMLKLFSLANEHALDIHPFALSAVTRSLQYFNSGHQQSAEARGLFLQLLVDTSDPGPILRLMNEAGILGQMVPEFGEIVGQTQFNMYHHFTVDEHTLKAVEAIAEMERNDENAIFPFSAKVFPKIRKRRALYLAMLLHDTGKGLGDQQIEGAKTAEAASLRLGVDQKEADLIAWLVGNHLEMSDCAQKRDISDPRTISQFANLVGDVERLNLLLILTVADIRAVGPDVWNGWKGQLLKDLYQATLSALTSNHTEEEEVAVDMDQRALIAQKSLKEKIGTIPQTMLQMDGSYWTSQPDEELIWHAEEITQSTHDTLVKSRVNEMTNSVELLVVTNDRPRLFVDLIGAMMDEIAMIASAQVFTGKTGEVIDVFVLQDDEGRMFGLGERNRLDRLEKSVKKAIEKGHKPPKKKNKKRKARELVFVVDPDVVFDNQGSADYTIIEVMGRERTRLLYEIANTLAENDVVLNSAHAGTYGERIHDTFYVQNAKGEKLETGDLTDKLACELLDILSLGSNELPRTPARVLTQARSSESF